MRRSLETKGSCHRAMTQWRCEWFPWDDLEVGALSRGHESEMVSQERLRETRPVLAPPSRGPMITSLHLKRSAQDHSTTASLRFERLSYRASKSCFNIQMAETGYCHTKRPLYRKIGWMRGSPPPVALLTLARTRTRKYSHE